MKQSFLILIMSVALSFFVGCQEDNTIEMTKRSSVPLPNILIAKKVIQENENIKYTKVDDSDIASIKSEPIPLLFAYYTANNHTNEGLLRWYISATNGSLAGYIFSLGEIETINGTEKVSWREVSNNAASLQLIQEKVVVGNIADNPDHTFLDWGLGVQKDYESIQEDIELIRNSTVNVRWWFFQAPNHAWYITNKAGNIYKFETKNGQYDWQPVDIPGGLVRFYMEHGIKKIEVDPPNKPPLSNAGSDQTTTINQTITVTGSGTDNDGTIVSYLWKEGNTVLANTASFEYTPTSSGVHILTLIVTDNDGVPHEDTVKITVEELPTTSESSANKGPFKIGSIVTAYRLNADGSRSSTTSNTTTTDNKGTFNIDIPWEGATELNIIGQYLNETTGTYMSDGNLSAIVNMSIGTSSSVGINILTHMSAQVMRKKMAEGATPESAKAEASEMIKKQFNLELDADTDLETLDITSSDNPANAQLLQLSAALMSTSNPAQTLQVLSDNMEEDGVNERGSVALEAIKEKSKEVDLVEVAQHIQSNLEGEELSVPTSLASLDGKLSWEHNISFEETVDAFRDTPYLSNEIRVVNIIGESATISIVDGQYSIDGGEFTTEEGDISNGQKLKIQITSLGDYAQKTTAKVTIGGIEIPYSVTTEADPFVADTQPNAFEFDFKSDQPLNTIVESEAMIVTGINSETALSIADGFYSKNGEEYTDADGEVVLGDSIKIKHYSDNGYYGKQKSTLTIGGVEGSFSSYTFAKDSTPDAFEFENQYDVEPHQIVESAPVVISGINAPTTVSVEHGEYKIRNRDWTSEDGLIETGWSLTLRGTSGDHTEENNISVTVGNMMGTFRIKTKPTDPDYVVDNFDFGYKIDQNLSDSVESDEIIVSGINREVTISIENGLYSINGGGYTDEEGTIEAGNSIRIQQQSSSEFSTKTVTTLSIGEVNGTFETITTVKDKTPELFSFDTQMSVATNSDILSNTITIRGINVPLPISVTNGSIMGGVTTINNNETISILQHSSTQQGEVTVSTLTVGTISASFTTKTVVDTPHITGTPPQSVNEDSDYSFTPTIESDSGEIALWSITNKPSWARFNPITGNLSGTPNNADVGTTDAVVITATNGAGSDETTTVNITVENSNDAPIMEVTPVTKVAQGDTYTSFTPTVTDEDVGDSRLFSLTNAPDWMSIDSNTGEVSGTRALTNDDVGTYSGIILTVTDSGGATATHTFTVTVTNSNDAPTISGTAGDQADEDALYSFTPTATDPDGDPLLFSIVNRPSWATFDTATGRLSGTPTNNDVRTTNDIVISVTDGAMSVSLSSFNLTVINTNDAPTIGGLPIITINEEEPYHFRPTANDIDVGDTQTFTLSGNPSWLSIDSNDGTVSGSAEVGVFNLVLTVSDNDGLTDTLSFTLTVLHVNKAPVLGHIDDITIDEDNNATVTLNMTDEDTADEHFYTIDIDHREVVATQVGNQLNIVPQPNFNGVVNISVTVSDGKLTDTQSFLLTIATINDVPILDVDIPSELLQDTPLVVTATVIDPDVEDHHTFRLTNNPSWMSIDEETGEISGTPSNDDVNTTTGIELKITDTVGAFDLVEFNITVINKNDAPTIEGTPQNQVSVGSQYLFVPIAHDIDRDTTLRFTIEGKPDWAEFNETTGELQGVPMFVNIDTYDSITISVTDEENSTALDSFSIEVVDDANLTPLPISLPTTFYAVEIDDGEYGYTEVLFGDDSKAYFTNYELNQSASFVLGESQYFLAQSGWTLESAGKAFELHDDKFIDFVDENERAAVISQTDISGEEINISGLTVTIPNDAIKFDFNIRAYGNSYTIWKAVVNYETNTTYSTMSSFMDEHCEQSQLIGKNGSDHTIGLNLRGDGAGDCNTSSATSGILQEVDDANGVTNPDAGIWVIKTINEVEMLLLYPTIDGYNDEEGDENRSKMFAMFDEGSGEEVWEGAEYHKDGTPMLFEMYNDRVIDAIKERIIEVNTVELPSGYTYGVINNSGEEIETTIEVDGVSYFVKLYANYAESADSQKNHKGAKIKVNGVESETLSIQSTYVGHEIVAAIYKDDSLVAVSELTLVDEDAPGVILTVDIQ